MVRCALMNWELVCLSTYTHNPQSSVLESIGYAFHYYGGYSIDTTTTVDDAEMMAVNVAVPVLKLMRADIWGGDDVCCGGIDKWVTYNGWCCFGGCCC